MTALLPFESRSEIDRGGTPVSLTVLHSAPTTRPCTACQGMRFTLLGTCPACYGTGRQEVARG